MTRIAIMVADGSEEVETITPCDILRRAELNVDLISITAHTEVTCSRGVKLVADTRLKDVNLDEYDMIVLPGGVKGTENFKACAPLLATIKAFATSGKALAAICAAPTVLSGLGLLTGKRAICNPSFYSQLEADGALLDTTAKTITVDNIITSKAMGTSLEFALAILEYFRGEDIAVEMASKICSLNEIQ